MHINEYENLFRQRMKLLQDCRMYSLAEGSCIKSKVKRILFSTQEMGPKNRVFYFLKTLKIFLI